MKATLIIEYNENLKGEGRVTVVANTDPEGEVSAIYWLGLLELGKEYILQDNWIVE